MSLTPGGAPKEPRPAASGADFRKLRVVACEDSALMREYIESGLAHFGITVEGVANGAALDRAMEEREPDIVVLDIGLPGEDGYSIAERLRRDRPHVGIIMLTARDQVDDRVKGLDCGADLYFAKPVDMRELASAIGSLQRRLLQLPAPTDNWRLDILKSRLVTPTGIEIELTDNELRFLTPLFEQPGEVVDREDLLRALEQKSDIYAMRRLETMVSRLRTKVQKASPDEPIPVRARHGRGYAFLSETNL